MHWYGPWDGHMGGWMVLWWVVGLIVLIALVWLVVVALSRTAGPGGPPREVTGRSAEEIIHERYARGEIDRATHDAMIDDVRGGRASARPPPAS